ncbi:MAG TPA: hypothetical protein VEZ11_14480, partial [Thermoanaerobaculia bacterium]|nr:hypothetical protein [Thermoanaerobaculia bacterium]
MVSPPGPDAPPEKTAPIRILYVITKANWGGAQKYVFDLSTCAAREGFAVTVAHGAPGELADRLHDAGIRTIEIPGFGRDVNPA